jgi:hypothetical protein
MVPKASNDVIARTVCGETLLVPVRGNVAQCDCVFILNQTGSFLWSQIDGTRSVDELSAAVRVAFEHAPAGSVEDDVGVFLAAMDARGLIVWENEA